MGVHAVAEQPAVGLAQIILQFLRKLGQILVLQVLTIGLICVPSFLNVSFSFLFRTFTFCSQEMRMVGELCPIIPQPFVGPYLVDQEHDLFPPACSAYTDILDACSPCLLLHIDSFPGPGENATR